MSRIGRPRAATVIAFVALVAALSGTAYAAKTMITSKNIVDGTIKGKDVKDDALKGKHVKESTLGKVPNSAQADSAGNANTVAGKSADELDTRWVLVDEDGEIEAQSGGFTIVDCYTTNANCYIDIGEDATNNGLGATIAINNTDGSATLSGQIGIGACGLTSIACAPPNTDLPNVVVAAPRDSAGAVPGGVTPPAPADASRFYVEITGSEAIPTPAP